LGDLGPFDEDGPISDVTLLLNAIQPGDPHTAAWESNRNRTHRVGPFGSRG